MYISENSLIYRFQANALVSEGERYIPTNFCPYMRRFLRLLFGSTVAFTIFTGVAIAMLAVPTWLLMHFPITDLTLVVLLFGTAFWVVAAGVVAGYWAKRSDRFKASRANTQKTIHKVWSPIGRKLSDNIFVRWYKAHHDQICPPIQFFDD